MLPMIMKIRIVENGKRVLSLWLPLFILWPLVLVLLVLILPFVTLGCLISGALKRGVLLLPILTGGFQIACALKGLDICVRNQKKGDRVEVRMA
jgi:hypothetical protein